MRVKLNANAEDMEDIGLTAPKLLRTPWANILPYLPLGFAIRENTTFIVASSESLLVAEFMLLCHVYAVIAWLGMLLTLYCHLCQQVMMPHQARLIK